MKRTLETPFPAFKKRDICSKPLGTSQEVGMYEILVSATEPNHRRQINTARCT